MDKTAGRSRRRRVWPWLLLALLLLAAALVLLLALAPTLREGPAVAYDERHRWAILAAGEGGWLTLVLAARSWLAGRGAGVIARATRLLAGVVLVTGVGLAAGGGWLAWSFLSANVHGTPSTHHHHDWDCRARARSPLS